MDPIHRIHMDPYGSMMPWSQCNICSAWEPTGMAISPKTDLPRPLRRFERHPTADFWWGKKRIIEVEKVFLAFAKNGFTLAYILVSGIDGAGEQPVGRKCMAHYAHSFSPIAFVRSVEKHMRNKGLTMANACLPVPGSAEDISNLQSRDSCSQVVLPLLQLAMERDKCCPVRYWTAEFPICSMSYQ